MEVFRWGVFRGRTFPGGGFPRGSYPWGGLFKGGVFRGVLFRGWVGLNGSIGSADFQTTISVICVGTVYCNAHVLTDGM